MAAHNSQSPVHIHNFEQVVKAGSVLFRQGEGPSRKALVLRSGELELVHTERDGHQATLALLSPPRQVQAGLAYQGRMAALYGPAFHP